MASGIGSNENVSNLVKQESEEQTLSMENSHVEVEYPVKQEVEEQPSSSMESSNVNDGEASRLKKMEEGLTNLQATVNAQRDETAKAVQFLTNIYAIHASWSWKRSY